jgi:hypothetical protein
MYVNTNRPRRLYRRAAGKSALFCDSPSLFDNQNLPASIHTTVGADVVGPLQLSAITAGHELRHFQENVPSAVSLAVAADSLFRQCAHYSFSPIVLFNRVVQSLRIVTSLIEQRGQRRETFIDLVITVV